MRFNRICKFNYGNVTSFKIKDIAAKASKNKAEFRNAEDKVLGFCKDSKVPEYVQQKVRDYFYYMWQFQRTLGA